MIYNCDITEKDGKFIAQFPDMTNVLTYGSSLEEALEMAKDALDGVLSVDIENGFPIPPSKYTGGYPVEVSPKVAFAIELRKARAEKSLKEVAEKAGMTYQQYQRLENPRKTNPTLETLYKLQKVFNHPFLAL
ncbi:MAG: type II toxin-antitoxin system HicB family antitoxin [Spirochaetaceae bacterium]|nr:type II toxin-antitoxin system HicB family antitoxin [Spirochaetaceae bacterium]